MGADVSKKPTGSDGQSARDVPWFATFTFLDAGCAISSSQLKGLVALFTRMWRKTMGRLLIATG